MTYSFSGFLACVCVCVMAHQALAENLATPVLSPIRRQPSGSKAPLNVLDQGAEEAEVDDDKGADYEEPDGGEGADDDDKHVTTTDGETAPQECDGHDRDTALENYRKGKAEIFFYHITHHAGTSFRDLAKRNGAKVNFPREEAILPRSNLSKALPCHSNSWVSVIAMRDPMARIFSQDGAWQTTATENLDKCNTDNYGLRNLGGIPFGEKLTWEDVRKAKERLEKFDFVLDVGSLSTSLQALCNEVGWGDCKPGWKNGARDKPKMHIDKDIYERLRARNRFEIELYKYAKELSLSQSEPAQSDLQVDDSEGHVSMNLMDEESHLKWTCPKQKAAVDS